VVSVQIPLSVDGRTAIGAMSRAWPDPFRASADVHYVASSDVRVQL